MRERRYLIAGTAMPTLLALLTFAGLAASGQQQPRARELGVRFDGTPGRLNAITDVRGVEVGTATLVSDADPAKPVRTGVTAVFPRARATTRPFTQAGSPRTAMAK